MARYEIRDVVSDYGIYEDGELKLILNSRSNAEYIKAILEHEDRHPNAAVPYTEFAERTPRELAKANSGPKVADMSDEACLAVFRLCIEDGYHCDACPLACTEGCESYVDIERRVLAMAERAMEKHKEGDSK